MKLSSATTYLSRGISPSYDTKGVVVLNQKCIRDNRVDLTLSRITNPDKKRISEDKYLQQYDVVVNSTGVGTLGRVAQIKQLSQPMTVDSHVTIVRPDLDQYDASYFGYAMFFAQSQIERMGDGATGQTELSRSRLGEEIDIPEFSKNTQEKIGRILGAYDNLIENNSKRIEKLEAMARILYRHAIETKDVEEVKMGDVANIKWGDTSKTKKSYVPENNAFIAYSASGPDGFLPYFDYDQTGIVLSAIGANCGKTWLARGKWSCIKNTIRYFTKSDVVSNEFLYLATEGGDVWPTRGSAQPFISQGDVIASRVQILSDEGKMRELSKELSKYFELIDILSKRNHKLAQARDMLLPRLMSGEIKV